MHKALDAFVNKRNSSITLKMVKNPQISRDH